MNKRFSLLLALLWLTGCEQARPPSAEGLKKILARTATGTVFTKLEARPQPEPPRAGEVSIWDLKVFRKQDKPDGTREEWKFFSPLPQPSDAATISDVLMQAWIVSRDGSVFLPVRPSYKAYGSFVTDWTLPRPGAYTLFVQYKPSEKGKTYPTETARWNFEAAPGTSKLNPLPQTPHWTPSQNPAPITLHGEPDGEPAGTLSIAGLPTKAGQSGAVTLKNGPQGAQNAELVAVSEGGQLLHFPAAPDGSFAVNFPRSAMYRVWASFTLNGAPYAAPLNHWIGP